MEVLYLLIPVSVLLAGVVALAFVWAVGRGQFEDIERHGHDVLDESEANTRPQDGIQ